MQASVCCAAVSEGARGWGVPCTVGAADHAARADRGAQWRGSAAPMAVHAGELWRPVCCDGITEGLA